MDPAFRDRLEGWLLLALLLSIIFLDFALNLDLIVGGPTLFGD